MNKKYGTTGHIEKVEKTTNYYQKTSGKKCIYRDKQGKCSCQGYINRGMNCKRPGACHNFIPEGNSFS